MKHLKLENITPIQENFLGHNAVYHGYAGLPDDAGRVYSDELCEIEADRAAALGIKVARTQYKWLAYDFEKKCWDWENAPAYVAFCKWVERLKVRGIDVALNTGWCSPGDILSSSWGGNSPFTVEGDWNASVLNYAKWVSDTVHDLVEVRGLTNVKYLVMFTEPQRLSGTTVPSGPDNAYECWYQATKAAVDRLKKDGRRHLVKIIGPNEGSTDDPLMMKWVKEKDPDLVDIYTAHNYLHGKSVLPVEKGKASASGYVRGMRVQQTVTLKPYTEYEMSVTAMAHIEDAVNVSGYMLMGAFTQGKSESGLFSAGGQPTTRLTRYSAKMVQAALLNEDMTEYIHRFTTEDIVDNVAVGVFFDIIQPGSHAAVTRISLKEVNTGKEILKSTEFQNSKDWRQMCMAIAGNSSYDAWCSWIKTYLKYLDDGDTFWFDEYNTIGRGVFEDYDHPKHGTEIAMARIAFMNMGLQSSLMWTLFDQQWPNNHTMAPKNRFIDGDHRFGIMPLLTRSLTPYPAYYALQITGYAGGSEGTVIYKGIGDGEVNLSMTEAPDKTVTVLVVNDDPKEAEITVTAERPFNCDLYRYLYDPAAIIPDEKATPIPSDKTFKNVGECFTDVIPPYSVVAYTSKLRSN